MTRDTDEAPQALEPDLPPTPDLHAVDPLARRAIEVNVADAFHTAIRNRYGGEAADALLDEVVRALAEQSAAQWRERHPDPALADLWALWRHLGSEGRLDLHLDELGEHRLRFRVDRCAYADMYRSRGLEALGAAFSCRRDAPFAEAFLPGVAVTQSRTILEGAPCCEFTYTLEDR